MKKNPSLLHLLLALAIIFSLAGCRAAPAAPTRAPEAPETESPAAGEAETNLPYQDPNLPVEERVEDLLARMTLEEKAGQMTQVEKNSIRPQDIARLSIGSILSGGGGYPASNTPEGWAEMVDGFQEEALKSRLGIPLLYGVDAVHGHNNLKGATIFPHNIGLGAAGDPELVERVARATAAEMAATGIRWNFAPVVAVPQDIRWGRTYEGFGENTELVTRLGAAYVRGLQGNDLTDPLAALATPKHYIGDGGTAWGSSMTGDYSLDQGDTRIDEAELRRVHLPPYQQAIEAGALSVMVSFSSWNGVKMHGHSYLVNDVLKGELGFEGFVVSDWQGIDQLPGDYYSDVVNSINAGLDMVMVPYDYQRFYSTLLEAVRKGDISEERIDDAVRRILRVKFLLGLFERPFADPDHLPLAGAEEHRQLAREAVVRSLVLLKNDGQALPLAKDAGLVLVAGPMADSIGDQSGGWTIEWQGRSGNITPGVTILEAVQEVVGESAVVYDRRGNFNDVAEKAAVGIVVVGETPYAEGVGDSADLSLPRAQVEMISRMREKAEKVVVIILSGRPLIITEQLPLADAWVAAWLPGTEGQGVADVLFGDRPFTGKLPYTWPRSMDQLPFDFENLPAEGCDAPLFPYGYGLDADSPPPDLPDCD